MLTEHQRREICRNARRIMSTPEPAVEMDLKLVAKTLALVHAAQDDLPAVKALVEASITHGKDPRTTAGCRRGANPSARPALHRIVLRMEIEPYPQSLSEAAGRLVGQVIFNAAERLPDDGDWEASFDALIIAELTEAMGSQPLHVGAEIERVVGAIRKNPLVYLCEFMANMPVDFIWNVMMRRDSRRCSHLAAD